MPPCPGFAVHACGEGSADGTVWDSWAALELCADGEEPTGKINFPQYLLAGA